MIQDDIHTIDPLIHAPVRLAVLSVLISVESADFSYLKKAVHTTDGNLSTHLARLEKAGYIRIDKHFEDKKPRTVCTLTSTGKDMFIRYLDNLQKIIDQQRGAL